MRGAMKAQRLTTMLDKLAECCWQRFHGLPKRGQSGPTHLGQRLSGFLAHTELVGAQIVD